MTELNRRHEEASRIFDAMSERQWDVFAFHFTEAIKPDTTEEQRAFSIRMSEQIFRKVQRDLNGATND